MGTYVIVTRSRAGQGLGRRRDQPRPATVRTVSWRGSAFPSHQCLFPPLEVPMTCNRSPAPLVPFLFEGTAPVRVVLEDDGEPWFVATDVCAILGIIKHRAAIARLEDDEERLVVVDTPRGPQEITAISESGVYALVPSGRKPGAARFRSWLRKEVLPSIRKTGSNSVAGATKVPDLPALLTMSRSTLFRLCADLTDKVEEQGKHIAAQAPAVKFYEEFADSEGDFCLLDAATYLRIRPRDFYGALEEESFCFRRPSKAGRQKKRLIAHSKYVDRGLFRNHATLVTLHQQRGITKRKFGQTLVTGKGIEWLSIRLGRVPISV
ncbi:BRO family protein [Myxococcus sp. AS-1-15]|uniref:BRO family protein n=1 Tax=Myxococcus sp. AS-1-15 TaxID=2874600 RepID=UPI00351CF6C0